MCMCFLLELLLYLESSFSISELNVNFLSPSSVDVNVQCIFLFNNDDQRKKPHEF